MKRTFYTLLLALLCGTGVARAQFVDDAVRLSLNHSYPSARAGALGLAYAGIADDFGATNINPAGLALIPNEEFSLGMQMHSTENTGLFLNNAFAVDDNSTALNHVAYAGKFDASDVANGTISLVYNFDTDFNQTFELSGFNSENSLIASWTAGAPSVSSPDDNIAYRLYLADTVNGAMFTPIGGQLLQESGVRESGGLHSLSGGMAFDVEENLAVGFAIRGNWGSYKYEREYVEIDQDNVYNELDTVGFTNVDFDRLSVVDRVEQDLAGLGFTLGMQSRYLNIMRFGFAISSPMFYTVEEDFSRTAVATFDNGDAFEDVTEGFNDYKISTAWTFSSGISFNIKGLVISGAAEYRTLNEISFEDGIDEVALLNRSIERVVDNQFNWGVGAEYNIPVLPIVVRGGFTHYDSPYADESFAGAREVISAGAGIYVAPNARFDTMVRSYSGSFLRTTYGDAMTNSALVDNQTLEVALQFHIRFGQ